MRKKAEILLDLLKDGYFYAQISSQMEVPLNMVMNQIKRIDPALVKEAKRKGKEVRELRRQGCSEELIEMVKRQPSNAKIPKNVTTKRIKRRINLKTLTELELIQYRKNMEIKKGKVSEEEVIILIEGYIAMGQLAEAISFLNILIGDEAIKQINMEKWKTMREEMLRTQKQQNQRKMNRQGKQQEAQKESIEIMEISESKELHLQRTKRKMLENDIEKYNEATRKRNGTLVNSDRKA